MFCPILTDDVLILYGSLFNVRMCETVCNVCCSGHETNLKGSKSLRYYLSFIIDVLASCDYCVL